MTRLAQIGLGLGFAFVLAAGAEAQPSSTDQGTATKSVSRHDMRKIKSCQAMDHGVMMNDHSCKRMMKLHPDLMNVDPSADSH